jgi:hypothetical protein
VIFIAWLVYYVENTISKKVLTSQIPRTRYDFYGLIVPSKQPFSHDPFPYEDKQNTCYVCGGPLEFPDIHQPF